LTKIASRHCKIHHLFSFFFSGLRRCGSTKDTTVAQEKILKHMNTGIGDGSCMYMSPRAMIIYALAVHFSGGRNALPRKVFRPLVANKLSNNNAMVCKKRSTDGTDANPFF
jgi:hypothetical protein